MKKFLRGVGIVLGAVLVLAALFILFLTITEFRPKASETAVELQKTGSKTLTAGSQVTLMTWNVGYSGLGAGSDFFMDGGTHVKSADKATVKQYLAGIADTVNRERSQGADIILAQEVDQNSMRSYHIDERTALASGDTEFAKNFSCPFIPYPMPPIGQVNSGILTTSEYGIDQANRISLPTPFKWPVRIANLKRCLLVSYIPVEGTGHDLVVVNLHLEAYDDGSGKAAQTAVLKQLLASEYEKGNYVIAGGDFNQEFPDAVQTYPNTHPELWTPGSLDTSMIPDGFTFAYDLSAPSCRLLNQPYQPEDTEGTQYYVIDGFILSPNVTLTEVKTLQENFANSDHNPVRIRVTLNP